MLTHEKLESESECMHAHERDTGTQDPLQGLSPLTEGPPVYALSVIPCTLLQNHPGDQGFDYKQSLGGTEPLVWDPTKLNS